MKKLKVSIFELIVYIVCGLLALWGLIYLCLGFACNFAKFDSGLIGADKYLRTNNSALGFLNQGIIIMVVGVVALVIALLVTSKKSDREFEKSQRRAARLQQRTNKVVDAEVKEISEEK